MWGKLVHLDVGHMVYFSLGIVWREILLVYKEVRLGGNWYTPGTGNIIYWY